MKCLLILMLGLCLTITVEADLCGAGELPRELEDSLVPMDAPSLAGQFNAERLKAATFVTLDERMAHYGVPGVSIAVIHGNQLVRAEGYGILRAGDSAPVTSETCFEAGSSTKLLTTVMALRLVQEGRCSLSADINDYLRAWHLPENDFTASQKVTLRRLLTHTAGLTRPDGGFTEEPGTAPTLVQVLAGQKPSLSQPALVVAPPGQAWDYSNHGYLVVQLLLEDLLEQPYRETARQWLFEPLGMTSSTLTHPLSASFHARTALPHDEEGTAHDRPQSPHILAQGGLVTTPSDLARLVIELMEAYAGRSDRLLSGPTVRRMMTEQVHLEPDQLFGMTEGLGVFLDLAGPSLIFTHHGFNSPGSTCMLLALPEEGCGLIVMANGGKGLQLSLEILAGAVVAYGWPQVS